MHLSYNKERKKEQNVMARIILVGGGSSSGKSFVTQAVIKSIGEENITRITMDDYYADQANIPLQERYKVNYDHPKAFDWPLMRKQIRALKEDQPIEKPIYDFVTHSRSPKTEIVTSVPAQIDTIITIRNSVSDTSYVYKFNLTEE